MLGPERFAEQSAAQWTKSSALSRFTLITVVSTILIVSSACSFCHPCWHVCVISCGKSNQASTVLFQSSMLVYVLSKRQRSSHWICSILNQICVQTDHSIHSIQCPDSLHVNKDNYIPAAVPIIEPRKDFYGVWNSHSDLNVNATRFDHMFVVLTVTEGSRGEVMKVTLLNLRSMNVTYTNLEGNSLLRTLQWLAILITSKPGQLFESVSQAPQFISVSSLSFHYSSNLSKHSRAALLDVSDRLRSLFRFYKIYVIQMLRYSLSPLENRLYIIVRIDIFQRLMVVIRWNGMFQEKLFEFLDG